MFDSYSNYYIQMGEWLCGGSRLPVFKIFLPVKPVWLYGRVAVWRGQVSVNKIWVENDGPVVWSGHDFRIVGFFILIAGNSISKGTGWW